MSFAVIARKFFAALVLTLMLAGAPAPASACAACPGAVHPQAAKASAHSGEHCMKSGMSAAMGMTCRRPASSLNCVAGASELSLTRALPASLAGANISICLGRAVGAEATRRSGGELETAAARRNPHEPRSSLILRI